MFHKIPYIPYIYITIFNFCGSTICYILHDTLGDPGAAGPTGLPGRQGEDGGDGLPGREGGTGQRGIPGW